MAKTVKKASKKASKNAEKIIDLNAVDLESVIKLNDLILLTPEQLEECASKLATAFDREYKKEGEEFDPLEVLKEAYSEITPEEFFFYGIKGIYESIEKLFQKVQSDKADPRTQKLIQLVKLLTANSGK